MAAIVSATRLPSLQPCAGGGDDGIRVRRGARAPVRGNALVRSDRPEVDAARPVARRGNREHERGSVRESEGAIAGAQPTRGRTERSRAGAASQRCDENLGGARGAPAEQHGERRRRVAEHVRLRDAQLHVVPESGSALLVPDRAPRRVGVYGWRQARRRRAAARDPRASAKGCLPCCDEGRESIRKFLKNLEMKSPPGAARRTAPGPPASPPRSPAPRGSRTSPRAVRRSGRAPLGRFEHSRPAPRAAPPRGPARANSCADPRARVVRTAGRDRCPRRSARRARARALRGAAPASRRPFDSTNGAASGRGRRRRSSRPPRTARIRRSRPPQARNRRTTRCRYPAARRRT